MSAGLVGLTLVFRQGDPGLNPVAGTETCEVYPGLGILQPQWNPYLLSKESLPRLLLRHSTVLQCMVLSTDAQHAVWYQYCDCRGLL